MIRNAENQNNSDPNGKMSKLPVFSILSNKLVDFRPAAERSGLVLRGSTRKRSGPSNRVFLHDGRVTSISIIVIRTRPFIIYTIILV